MDNQWLCNQVLDSHSRIKRAERVLKNYLRIPSYSPQFSVTGLKQIVPIKPHLPRSRLNQSQGEPAQGALA
jgi:hypothetical protein